MLVGGCKGVAKVCRLFDTWVVDMVYNLSARITERLAALSGLVVDAWGVDGAINGLARLTQGLADGVRRPQTGRIRNYVAFAAGAAAVAILGILVGDELYSAVVGLIGR